MANPARKPFPFPFLVPLWVPPRVRSCRHSRFLVRQILPVVSSASRGRREKRARAGWQDMNSKHKYTSSARDGRWEYLPVIGRETWRFAGGKSHRAAFVRFIASTRWHFQDFRPAKKRILGVIQRRRVDIRECIRYRRSFRTIAR